MAGLLVRSNANEKKFFLRPCDQTEILLIINSLKSSIKCLGLIAFHPAF